MGWEQRGTHRYYYRKEREGSRVKSVYVGRGEVANLISQFESSSTVFERLLGVTRQSEAGDLEAVDGSIEQTCRLIDAVTQVSLLVAGFHTHKRQWRKLRL